MRASRCRKPSRRSSPPGSTPSTRRPRRSSATRRSSARGSGWERSRTSAACAPSRSSGGSASCSSGSSSARSRASAVADESQYAFWHVLVRDVAYAQIPRAARVDKHRAAAEWIESLAPGRGDLTELLAHHYTSALEYARLTRQATGDLAGRARLALRDAGEHALGVYAYGAAARFFRGALELWPEDDPARPQLLFELGKSLFWSERDGGDELAEARDALVAAGDTGRAAQADILLSRLNYRPRPTAKRAGVHAANAVELLRGSAPSAEQAEAISNLAAFHALNGDTDRALEAIGEALALAEALGLDEVRAEALTFRGHARMVAGDDTGIEDLEQAVEVAEGLRSPVLVRSCANLATVSRRARPARSRVDGLRPGPRRRGAARRRGRAPLARRRASLRALLARQLGRGAGAGRVLAAGARRRLGRPRVPQHPRVDQARPRRRGWCARGCLECARVRPRGEGAVRAVPGPRAQGACARGDRPARRGGAARRRGPRPGRHARRSPVLLVRQTSPMRCTTWAASTRRAGRDRIPLGVGGPPARRVRVPGRRRRVRRDRGPAGGGEDAPTRRGRAGRRWAPRRRRCRARAGACLLRGGRRRGVHRCGRSTAGRAHRALGSSPPRPLGLLVGIDEPDVVGGARARLEQRLRRLLAVRPFDERERRAFRRRRRSGVRRAGHRAGGRCRRLRPSAHAAGCSGSSPRNTAWGDRDASATRNASLATCVASTTVRRSSGSPTRTPPSPGVPALADTGCALVVGAEGEALVAAANPFQQPPKIEDPDPTSPCEGRGAARCRITSSTKSTPAR